MFDNEDIVFLEKHSFSIEAPNPPTQLKNLVALAGNQFLFLENNRFINSQFIKFPDEQRGLHHSTGRYHCFGKAYCHQYFLIGESDETVYWITTSKNTLIFCQINENIKNFVSTYHYFLMSMYQIIAERCLMVEEDDDSYEAKIDRIYRRIANNFRRKVMNFEDFAFPKGKTQSSFWIDLYNMMLEAELAFHLPNVSLFDYIETKRFGNIDWVKHDKLLQIYIMYQIDDFNDSIAITVNHWHTRGKIHIVVIGSVFIIDYAIVVAVRLGDKIKPL